MKKRNCAWQVSAFFIPFFASVLICAGQGVYPFGSSCILHVDMYHQYCPFFTELMEKLKTGGSLMYCWELGVGGDFVGLMAYYLASPLNFLMLFWPRGYVIEFMTFLTWFKVGFCGLAFFCFLKGHFGIDTDNRGGAYRIRTLYPALIFSTAYAFSGYVAAYSWNIMWMDGVMLAPLVLLGAERLADKKSARLYYVSLALAILSNYYIAIMLCMFVVLYFAAYLCMKERGELTLKKAASAAGRFALYSLLAGASAAVLLLPELKILGYSASSSIRFPKEMRWYFGFFEEMARACTTAAAYTGSKYWPNLYAGAFCFLLFFLYLLNKNISVRKKVCSALSIVFFLVSFANNMLDFIWHGLHFPDSLPARQSFLYILVMLTVGYAVVQQWDAVKIRQLIPAGIASAAILTGGAIKTDEAVTERTSVLITGLFIACYICLFFLTRFGGKKSRESFKRLLLVVAMGEVIIHMAVTGYYTTGRTSYVKNTERYAALLETAGEREGDGFFRVEDIGRLTKNDDMRFHYRSISQFSSLMNIEVSHLFQSLYMEGGKNFYCYNGATPLTSALFSVKYILSENSLLESPYRRLIAERDGAYLYENTYCLPLGFVMPEEAIAAWKPDRTNRLESVNAFAEAFGAPEALLYEADHVQTVEKGSTEITVAEDGYYYICCDSCKADSLTAKTENHGTRKYSKTTHRYMIEIGALLAGEQVAVTNAKGEELTFLVYRLSAAAVDAAYETLSAQGFALTSFSDTRLEGRVDVKEAGRLVFSIPAEEGWSILLDGKKADMEPFFGALLAVPVGEGTHEIVLTYETPWLRSGALISCCALLAACALLWAENRKMGMRRKQKNTGRIVWKQS